MDDHERFGLDLIIAEEPPRHVPVPPDGTRTDDSSDQPSPVPETTVFDERNVVVSGTFFVHPGGGTTIDGPGTLDSLVLFAQSMDFSVLIDTGTATVIDDLYETLRADTVELDHVAAYEREDGVHILTVSDFPFKDRISVQIRSGGVQFNRIRAVYTLGRPNY